MDIAERIKKLREVYDITSNDLAKITGIHPVSIRKYETNKMVPGIDVIDKMCDALKLPRMVFEGIPPQYTDFAFRGDFYQLLFQLLANGTLDVHGYAVGDSKESTYFTLNPQLAKYMEIKNGDEIIPLENITITPRVDETRSTDTFYKFNLYLKYLKNAQDVLNTKKWNVKSEGQTKEEYAAQLNELAKQTQLELMLEDHSWKQHMPGLGNMAEINETMEKFILNGGNYYEFIEQAELPETMKAKYIASYEDAYVSQIIESQNDPYPGDSSKEEKFAWIDSIQEQIKKYKEDHPDYKEQAKQHAIENAQKARENAKQD